jgi:hypothetical protein
VNKRTPQEHSMNVCADLSGFVQIFPLFYGRLRKSDVV